MTFTPHLKMTMVPHLPRAGGPRAGRHGISGRLSRSKSWERFLLGALVLLFPLESNLPTLFGISAGKVVLMLVASWVCVAHFKALLRVLRQPVFLTLALFLCWAALNELFHPLPSLEYIYRVAQMVGASILIAALCTDAKALKAALLGFVTGGFLLSLIMWFASHGTLSMTTAQGFQEASEVRKEAFATSPLQENLNRLSFLSAQGAFVALALALGRGKPSRRLILAILGLFCLVGTFLPLSRGGVINALASIVVVLFSSRRAQPQRLALLLILPLVLFLFVPKVAFQRMTLNGSDSAGREESRIRLYKAALTNVREYLVFGIGAGNYWSYWGKTHGFGKHEGTVGAHNSFLQVLIMWGVPGLVTLLLAVYQVYRCLPKANQFGDLSAPLNGLALSCLIFLATSHNLYYKQLSMGLGLLVAARLMFGEQQPHSQYLQKRGTGRLPGRICVPQVIHPVRLWLSQRRLLPRRHSSHQRLGLLPAHLRGPQP